MRKKYRMTDEDYQVVMDACRPVAMIALQCGPVASPQENANRAWQALGAKMGFDYLTVEADGPDAHDFTAEPR